MISTSEIQTLEIARLLWDQVKEDFGKKPIIFALTGPLAAGKTRFAKGIAMALGVSDNIVSPTYVLEGEYNIPRSEIKFIHIDAYRMETADELTRLGFDRRIKQKSVMVIEWVDKFPHLLEPYLAQVKVIWVDIKPGAESTHREINWKSI